MATSAMSRLVIVRELLKTSCCDRIAVWGMPGNNGPFRPDDLNAEKDYVSGFGWVHQNTVAANEALVLHLSAQAEYKDKTTFVGMNPGLVATSIRDSMYNVGFFRWIFEGLIGLFTPTAESYAKKMLPVLVAPDLAKHSGVLLSQSGAPILPSKCFLDDPSLASKIYNSMEALLRAKTGL